MAEADGAAPPRVELRNDGGQKRYRDGDATVDMRMTASHAYLRVPSDALALSTKAKSILKQRHQITWCFHERCGVDCESRFAAGVGRDGCAFAHLTPDSIRQRAIELVKAAYPELCDLDAQQPAPKSPKHAGEGAPAAGKTKTIYDELHAAYGGMDFGARAEFPVGEAMTVVLTTSPTASNPSTQLLEAVLASFAEVPRLREAQLIIVCDGYELHDPASRAKKPGFKRNLITADAAARYEAYKERVKVMPTGALVVELPERNGFGWAVRHALSQHVRTKYTMVVQHDRFFETAFDLPAVLAAMDAHPEYKLVYMQNASLHGHLSKIRNRAVKIREPWSDPFFEHRSVADGVTLAPCMAWLDTTHIARTEHLISFVFGSRGAPAESGMPIKRGEFPEDKLNQVQIKALRVEGVASHARFGTWILTTASQDIVHVRHLSGRAFTDTGTSGDKARDILHSHGCGDGDDDNAEAGVEAVPACEE
eukprot:TRINITY_DN16715_c0_g1_i1.p1 TRINITY_DN16715_c0_g1~~TRINITY_DN16715_c0_g1_i1.p1  ORF type:complete len:496 (+),score=125.66 TRINITY_DN16715_c0_g1_i1:49-1488(+)